MRIENDHPLDPSTEILTALDHLKPTASSFKAIMFNTSKFTLFNREPKRIDFALEEATRIFSPIKGLVYKLKNHNLVCIIQRNAVISIERCIAQLKRTLPPDPILNEGHKKDGFYTIFDLGTQWEDFAEAVQEIENDPIYSSLKKQADGTLTQLITNGINLDTLANIEKILTNSNLLSYLRRQPIYWYDGKDKPRKIASHLFLSMQALQESLAISDPIMANTWLFKHITTLLDKQTITFLPQLLSHNSIENIHANINLRSIVTPAFHKFLHNYNKDKPLSFCIDIVDYMAHPDVLEFAHELLGEKNCRIIISSINAAHLAVMALDKIPANVFKINWSPAIMERKDDLKALIKEIGAYRLILHRCETEQDIQAGLECGIEQFQGFGIDKMLKKETIE
jgi:EAL domain-containing protein (putative c-di-GMP-specific phosphodiesterase class I)